MSKIFRISKVLWLKFVAVSFGWERYARMVGVTIGRNCRIYKTSFGSEPFLISIGDRVTVTSGVRFLTHDGSLCLLRDEKGRRYRYNRIEIGSDVFIGVNSIILPGVKIGSNSIVAAGSVVTKSVPPGSVVGGNPARWIMSFDVFQEKNHEKCVSDSNWKKSGLYESDVLSVLDESMKPDMKSPSEVSKN